jgi:hypothetical protein
MRCFKYLLLIGALGNLYAEDLVSTNLSYQKSRIKAKAKKSSTNDNICYEYVEISNTREWNKRKDELNTYIQNNKNKCKKYIIYKEVRNVNTGNAINNESGSKYEINLGVILEENPDVDIEIYTKIKNSTLQNSYDFTERKANIGSIIVENSDDDIDIDNRKLKAVAHIENSKIGQLNMGTEYGLNKMEEFLEGDKDDPFNK